MRRPLSAVFIFGLCIVFSLANVCVGETAERKPVITTPHFNFYSDFETNLNDALVTAGLARKDSKPELFHSGDETTCFEKLPPSRRFAWDSAVDYYMKVISPHGWSDRQQFLLRMDLVGFEGEGKDDSSTEFIEIARGFRAAATPAYKACRWIAQDEKNRRWIEKLKTRLAADEQKTAARIEQLYQKQWKRLPILVDVVQTVDWSGANTSWSDEGQGDVLISSAVEGAAAFETVFHEASHTLMDRSDPVRQALETAAKKIDLSLPNDLWHVVLFYTTGEAVRSILNERGEPDYSPMLYEIFKRDGWVEYREALETHWLPYVNGKKTLAEAAMNLISSLPKQEPQTKGI